MILHWEEISSSSADSSLDIPNEHSPLWILPPQSLHETGYGCHCGTFVAKLPRRLCCARLVLERWSSKRWATCRQMRSSLRAWRSFARLSWLCFYFRWIFACSYCFCLCFSSTLFARCSLSLAMRSLFAITLGDGGRRACRHWARCYGAHSSTRSRSTSWTWFNAMAASDGSATDAAWVTPRQ